MKRDEINRTYIQLAPSSELNDFVELYWEHQNLAKSPNKMTIFPDSFFKLIIEISNGKTVAYFLTGLWTKNIEIIVPAKTTVYGIKFKILAAEYIFKEEISSLLSSQRELTIDFLKFDSLTFDSLKNVAIQFDKILIECLQNNPQISSKKLNLSEILYKRNGNVSVEEVSKYTNWENRQINRYFTKFIGVSLKKYLNIQKVYAAYIQICEGRFFPDNGYYDQPHFIREIKKHTGQTPKELFARQNDRFIQLKHIKKK